MAKVDNNILVRGLSGSLGKQLVLKRGRNGTIVSKFPTFDENRTFSDVQVKEQSKFREAVEYAKVAKELEFYKEKAKIANRLPYHVAISDFSNPPEIREVDISAWNGQAGQVIRVLAVDDVMVTQVMVAILDDAGTVLVEGEAVQGGDAWWHYVTTTAVENGARIVVTARDMPGNTVQSTWND